MKSVYIYLSLFVLVSLILGCTSSRGLLTEDESSKGAEERTGIVNEFFDPLILDEEELKIKKTISIESKSEQMDESLTQPSQENQQSQIVPGFRVQICAVSDEERARQVQRDAILKFINEEVYLIYDSPYYKVRVGNCLTRYEADKLQQFAVEKGFDDAWVVRTKITLQPNDESTKRFENK